MDEIEIARRVREYLTIDRRREYRDVLEDIKSILESYDRTRRGEQAIYRITSRGDYQDGEELKKEREVIEKIKRRRQHDDSAYSVLSITDYIGIRIICVYPSDVVQVASYIVENLIVHDVEWNIPSGESTEFYHILRTALSSAGLAKPVKIKENNRGYRALHFVVSPRNKALKCELQIVTLLQETWAYKTHDTVYKNRTEEVEEEHRRQSRYLSDVLWAVDRQSELVKDQIERDRTRDELRRNVLIREHLLRLLSPEQEIEETQLSCYDPNGISFSRISSNRHLGMLLLKKLIQEKAPLIRSMTKVCTFSGLSDLLFQQVRSFEEVFDPFGQKDLDCCVDLMRIATLVAIMDETRERENRVLDYTEKFLQCAESQNSEELLAKAWLRKGWLLFCMAKLDEAIVATEKILKIAKDGDILHKAKANLAYFKAELLDRSLGRDRRELAEAAIRVRDECLRLLEEIPSTPQRRDTKGFVQIVFGTTLQDIEQGLQTCQAACEETAGQDKRLVQLFLQRHKRRALERWLDTAEVVEDF